MKDETKSLIERIQNGDASARKELIAGYLRLARRISYHKTKHCRHRQDDLFSELLCSLFFNLMDFLKKPRDDFYVFIITRWKYVVIEFFTSHRPELLFTTTRSIRRGCCFTCADVDELTVMDGGLSIELKEIIELACQDDLDGRIMSLWLEGFKGKEMAEVLGVSSSTVSRKLREVIERMRQWM